MRKALLPVAVLMVAGGFLVAGEIGPPEPVTDGEVPVSMSIGYTRHRSTYRAASNRYAGFPRELDVNRQQVALQANFLVAEGMEAYGALGVSTLENFNGAKMAESSFRRPYVTAGFRGLLFEQGNVGVGPFVQASYFSNYQEKTPGEKIQWRNMYDLVGGLSAQVAIENAVLYGGPMLYHSAAHLRREDRVQEQSNRQRFTEKGNVGGFIGMSVPLPEDMTLGVEGRYRSDFSMGVSLTKAF